MNTPRLSDDDIAEIRKRIAAGESLRSISRTLGRHRSSVARIKAIARQEEARPLSVKLNFRLSAEEHAAFLTVAEANRLTVSEAIRHLVRQAGGRLALQAEEIEAIGGARRDLAAVGNNLNQLARLGAAGRLNWKPGDHALVRRALAHVDALVEDVVALVAEARGRAVFAAGEDREAARPDPPKGAAG